MILRSINIAYYGMFRDFKIENLPGGTVVFTGPNEAGKSTLLSFIRHTLFGYPAKNSKEKGPPATMGLPGGSVTLLDDSGNAFIVERYQTRKPTVRLPDGSAGDEDLLAALLGNFDLSSYRAVFGFDLDDLAGLMALNEERLRNRLLSAGISGAGDAVEAATRSIDKRTTELLKTRGDAVLNNLVAELRAIETERRRAEADQDYYSLLSADRESASTESAALRERLAALAAKMERLRTMIRLKPLAVRLSEAKTELESGDFPETFPEEGKARFDEIKNDEVRARAAVKSLEAEKDRIRRKLDGLAADGRLVAASGNVSELLRGLPAWEANRASAVETAAARAEAERRLKADLSSLGDGWTRDAVISVDSGLSRRREARRAAEEWERFKEAVRASEAEFEKARTRFTDLETAAPTEGWPDWIFRAAFAVNLVLLILAALFLKGEGRLLVLPALAALCGALAFPAFRGKKGRSSESLLLAGAELAGREAALVGARQRLEKFLADWRSSPTCAGLGPLAAEDPAHASDLLERLEPMRKDLSAILSMEERIGALDAEARKTEEREREFLAPLFPEAAGMTGRDLAEILRRAGSLVEAETIKARDAALAAEDLAANEADLSAAVASLAEKTAELTALYALAGVLDEEGFRRAAAAAERKKELLLVVNETSYAIRSQFPEGAETLAITAELLAGDPDAWNADLGETENEASLSRTAYEKANREYGEASARLRELADSTRLSELDEKAGELRAEGTAAAREWRRAVLAGWIIRAGLNGFVRDRQPAVLAAAGCRFSAMTGGRYSGIMQPPGESAIRAVRSDAFTLSPDQLSRGAREELYLALRLGLAADFAERGTNLPMLADDVLVNFDPARMRKALESLRDHSRNGQLLFFTCHPHISDCMIDIDPSARVIELANF